MRSEIVGTQSDPASIPDSKIRPAPGRQGADELMPRVYDDLHRLASAKVRRDPAARTWQATDLVHEVYLKMSSQQRAQWKSSSHFFAVGAQAMRRILVDHARRKLRQKRGSGKPTISLDEALTVSLQKPGDIVALHDALNALAEIDPNQARMVEMRFFGGMTVAEVAEALSMSKRAVEAEWTAVKAWLRRELS